MHRPTTTPLAALALVGALFVVPACSGKSNAPSTTTTTASPQAHGSYEQCLSQHGVTAPTYGPPPGPGTVPAGPAPGPVAVGTPGGPPPPPPGVNQATWDDALKACASLRPSHAEPSR